MRVFQLLLLAGATTAGSAAEEQFPSAPKVEPSRQPSDEESTKYPVSRSVSNFPSNSLGYILEEKKRKQKTKGDVVLVNREEVLRRLQKAVVEQPDEQPVEQSDEHPDEHADEHFDENPDESERNESERNESERKE